MGRGEIMPNEIKKVKGKESWVAAGIILYLLLRGKKVFAEDTVAKKGIMVPTPKAISDQYDQLRKGDVIPASVLAQLEANKDIRECLTCDFEPSPESIYIKYPGLRIYQPQRKTVDIDKILDEARGLASLDIQELPTYDVIHPIIIEEAPETVVVEKIVEVEKIVYRDALTPAPPPPQLPPPVLVPETVVPVEDIMTAIIISGPSSISYRVGSSTMPNYSVDAVYTSGKKINVTLQSNLRISYINYGGIISINSDGSMYANDSKMKFRVATGYAYDRQTGRVRPTGYSTQTIGTIKIDLEANYSGLTTKKSITMTVT